MPLYIRYPSWATNGATIKVNGKDVKVKQAPGSYIVLNRHWKAGDKIDITYPMSLQAGSDQRQSQYGRGSIRPGSACRGYGY